MSRKQRSEEPDDWPEGYRRGADIKCEEMKSRIALNLNGNPTVFLHVLAESRFSGEGERLYSIAVGDRDPERRKKAQFVSLIAGILNFDYFLQDEKPYRILEDHYLYLPRGTENNFGVFDSSHELDIDLTRELFGCTRNELDDFLPAFSSVVEGYHRDRNWRHSRVTASKRSDNWCDLTHAWIPSHFPFIAVGDTQHFGGHVSLHGFYRMLAFLCPEPHMMDHGKEPRGFCRSLLDADAAKETIEAIKESALRAYRSPITWRQANPLD